jgi:hypothetical protein
VKIENRNPTRLLHPLAILEWKSKVVTINFITNLPRKMKKNDSIMVVVDKLTKGTHFTPVNSTWGT